MKNKAGQLLDRKSRAKSDLLFPAQELRDVAAEWQRLQSALLHFTDYVPVKIVNVIENTFRSSIRRIVDSKKEYKANSFVLLKQHTQKMGVAEITMTMKHIDGREFSWGEFISHIVPCNFLEDIVHAFQNTMGGDFKMRIGAVHERWVEDDGLGQPIIENTNETFGTINKILQIRHIIVHETPECKPYDASSISMYLHHAIRFVDALSWLVIADIEGSIAKTEEEKSRIKREAYLSKLLMYNSIAFSDEVIVSECIDDFHVGAVWSRYADRVTNSSDIVPRVKREG